MHCVGCFWEAGAGSGPPAPAHHEREEVAAAYQVDQGRVSEQGTPQQLAQAQGLYARFLARRRAAKGWRIAGTDTVAGTGTGTGTGTGEDLR